MQVVTHNVKLVLPLVILDVLLQLLKASSERCPLVGIPCLPDMNVARVSRRRDDRPCRVPLVVSFKGSQSR